MGLMANCTWTAETDAGLPGAWRNGYCDCSHVLCDNTPNPVREEQLMKHRTLDAVMSMPQSRLFYPVGTVTCIMVWIAGKPHAKSAKTWFGVLLYEDGFVITKHKEPY